MRARVNPPCNFPSFDRFSDQMDEFFFILRTRGIERGEKVGVVEKPKEGVGIVNEVEGGGGGRRGGRLEERKAD